MQSFARRMLLFILVLGSGLVPAWAQITDYAAELIQEARAKQLAATPMWQALLHYETDWLGGVASTVDDAGFFLAAGGQTNPQAELAATLQAFFVAPQTGVRHPQCRFRARFEWLRQQLQFNDAQLPPVACPEFDVWYATLNPGAVTLVFPSAYLNSPASMYGHTLLRIDPPSANPQQTAGSVLDSWAINFAADSRDTNGLVFAVKGLTGLYPGNFAVLPYYKKVNAYGAIENRDLWEYRLNLSATEIRWLLLHAWELDEVDFDYYFFDENCSYQLLALLLAAKPEAPLLDDFGLHAIPVDTLRAALAVPGIGGEVIYRPSLRTQLKARLAALTATEKQLVADLVEEQLTVNAKAVVSRPSTSQARILDTAYALLQYRHNRAGGDRQAHAARSLQLLRARSRIASGDTLPVIPTPAIAPQDGHASGRLDLAYGELGDSRYTELAIRPAYHDLLDPPGGFVPGAQLNMFALGARHYADGRSQLEYLRFVDILSLSPRDPFFKPLSWRFGFGLERQWLTPELRPLLGNITAGAGLAYQPVDGLFVYLMPQAQLLIGNDIPNGMTLGGGLQAGLVWYAGQGWDLLLQGDAWRYPAKFDTTILSWRQSLNIALSRNVSVRASIGEEGPADVRQRDIRLALLWYF